MFFVPLPSKQDLEAWLRRIRDDELRKMLEDYLTEWTSIFESVEKVKRKRGLFLEEEEGIPRPPPPPPISQLRKKFNESWTTISELVDLVDKGVLVPEEAKQKASKVIEQVFEKGGENGGTTSG